MMLMAMLVKVLITTASFGPIKLIRSSGGEGNLIRLLIPV